MTDTAAHHDAPPVRRGFSNSRVGRVWAWLRRRWRALVHRYHRWAERNGLSIYAAILLLIIGIMLMAPQIFVNIPAGHVGVKWLRFFGGTVTERIYPEGLHVIFPWNEMYIYDARLQNNAREYNTISSNGLTMQVEIAVRYRIEREAAPLLHKLVGPAYPEILVYPEIGAHARELIARYTPEQLYTEARAFIQAQILERMVSQLGSSLANESLRGSLVVVEDVLIRGVTLPDRIEAAIERKAEQYQALLEYDFRLARERKEAERKRIEAEGIRAFQETVAQTITQEYLRLRGIEATLSLSQSPNSKIVVIGGGGDGLPIILNTESGQGSSGGAGGVPEAAQPPPSTALSPMNAAPPRETPPNNALQDLTAPPPSGSGAGGGTSPAAPRAAPRAAPSPGSSGPASSAPNPAGG